MARAAEERGELTVFAERLREVARRIDGGIEALALVAGDGILVESKRAAEWEGSLEAVAAEMAAQARTVSRSHRELELGRVRQLSVVTDRCTILLSALSNGYYLLAVLAPDANYGRARFELRRAGLAMDEDLA